jgi:glycosyltransferase involved in cell wall biosynthesis
LKVAELVPANNVHVFSGPLYLCFQRGLIAWLRSWDPDVLILEANSRYPLNYLAQRWMHQRRRPVIGWGLGAPRGRNLLTLWSQPWRNRYLSSFDSLIAYSSKGAAQYRMLGFPDEKVFVALNAVSTPPTELPDHDTNQDRPSRVLFVGRLQSRKRLDLLFRACARISPQPVLWIVGDGPEVVKLKTHAKRVFPQAQFLGPMYGEELQERFRNADIFVLPGTGGLALQEAMANALPVIAAEGDGTQDDLVGSENGWLVRSGDLDQLINIMQEALQDRRRLRTMGKASFEIVQQRANIEVMASVFMQAINSVAQGK